MVEHHTTSGGASVLPIASKLHNNHTNVGLDRNNLPYNTTANHVETAGASIALFYGVVAFVFGCQYALLWWKKQHKRSYEGVTLLGLWVFPPAISLQLHMWRFFAIWAVWSTASAWLLMLCLRKRLDPNTPSTVYTWFLASHKVSVALGVAGYLLLLFELFGGGPLLVLLIKPGTSLIILWYGLYFGVLGRDVAEVASDQMAVTMHSGRQLAVSLSSCGICGAQLTDHHSHLDTTLASSHGSSNTSIYSISGQPGVLPKDSLASVQLTCRHLFHPLCIRGWTLVGKKSVCPVCLEKVDLRELFADRPWETRNLSWVQMLDTFRYVIVWVPTLLLFVHLPLAVLGIASHPHIATLPRPSNAITKASFPTSVANLSTAVNATDASRNGFIVKL